MNRDKVIPTLRQIKALADECLRELGDSARPEQAKKRSPDPPRTLKPANVDFDINERAFVKKYGRSLSGAKKFVLLVAYLAKGRLGVEVQLEDVRKHWNRMTSLLGMSFNTFYSNTAKDNGWVNTKKKGVYVISKSWQEVFGK